MKLCVIFLLLLLPLQAIANQSYIIDNISVDSDGENTQDARIKALSGGASEAFRQLAVKLNPAKSQDIISKTTISEQDKLVKGIEILSEKSSPKHYHAIARYHFYTEAIDAIFPEKSENVKSETELTENKNNAVLIIPVNFESDELSLWQEENKWRNIWYESALISGNGLIITPLGDLSDRVDVDSTNVEKATAKSLAQMYNRYGVAQIYIVTAYFNKKADPKPTLEVTLKRLIQDKDEVTRKDYTIHSTENTNELMARASNDIAKYLYRLQTINPNKIEFDRQKEINARVNISDIKEWENLRNRLLAQGNIVAVRFNSISFYETNMTISFKGTAELLGKTLVSAGLRVFQDGDSLVLLLQ
jgi:hypothetical protein